MAFPNVQKLALATAICSILSTEVLAETVIGTNNEDNLQGTADNDVILAGPADAEVTILTLKQLTRVFGGGNAVPAFSKSGNEVYYSGEGCEGDGETTCKLDLPTGEYSVVGQGSEPKSSADGSSFASQSTLSGINLYDPNGIHRYVSGRYEHVSWLSNDGKRVAFEEYPHVVFWDSDAESVRYLDTNFYGELANGGSWWALLSADEKQVVFSSEASNLISADTNGVRDLYLKSMVTGEVTRITTGWNGEEANGNSGGYGGGGSGGPNRGLDLSEDGVIVVYQSEASNLVPDDGNGHTSDIFIENLSTHKRSLISVGYDGSPANGSSTNPAVSGDGRFVVFGSEATNLVPNDTNNVADIFVADTSTGHITRITVGPDGSQANFGLPWWNFNYVSGDGHLVTFETDATNIWSVPVFTNRNVGVAELEFDKSDNYLFGFEGEDTIIGADGSDFVNAGSGDDQVFAGGGDDTIIGGEGDDFEVGGLGSDIFQGEIGNDAIYGDLRSDAPTTVTRTALSLAARSSSALTAQPAPALEVDTISYARAKAAITVNLKSGKASSTTKKGDPAKIGVDTLKGIENIKAGPFNDTLRGSTANNFIDGGKGRDTVIMSGKKSQYKVTYNSKTKTYVVVDKVAGRDGTDTLKNVEVIQFKDDKQVTMSLSTSASAD